MSATALKSTNRWFSSLNHQKFDFFCLVPSSKTHTGLICVKTLKPNISSLDPFKASYYLYILSFWQHVSFSLIFKVRFGHLCCWLYMDGGGEEVEYSTLSPPPFLLFAKCLKMYSFFRICILRLQKVLLWPQKKIFLEKSQYGYQKNPEFYADFKFFFAGFQKCP